VLVATLVAPGVPVVPTLPSDTLFNMNGSVALAPPPTQPTMVIVLFADPMFDGVAVGVAVVVWPVVCPAKALAAHASANPVSNTFLICMSSCFDANVNCKAFARSRLRR
jgi:hypothetical protein